MLHDKEFEYKDGKSQAKIEYHNDGVGDCLLVMTNGYQYSGGPINKKAAQLAIKALTDYLIELDR